MTFNYGLEKKKFDEAWKQTARFYAEQGMPTEAIEAMQEFDWDVFKGNRIEALHTQSLNPPEGNDKEDDEGIEILLLRKFFERFTSEYDTYGTHSRYWWIEEITDYRLLRCIKRLTEEDKNLLTMYFVEGYTQEESAYILHINQSTFSRRLEQALSKFTEK